MSLVIQHLLSNYRIQIFTYVRLSAQSDQFNELKHLVSLGFNSNENLDYGVSGYDAVLPHDL